jgi:uracil-DNA glycosylase family 4
MTLQLDARQRAMLAEMGVRLFDPAPAEAATMEVASTETARAPQAPASRSTPVAPAPVVTASPPGLPERVLAPLSGPVADMDWDTLTETVAACQACGLCKSRRHTVFGVGDRQADWLVVGEAPGEMEDLQGEPFVGPAGKLLDNMLRAIGLGRHENVYIANVLKCRPPGNRNPEPAEVAQCEPYLRRQVALLQPKIILAMGRFAVQSLLGSTEPIGKLRGQIHHYAGVPVVVTYHPAYLLRNLPDKAKAWADLCLALDQVESAG